MRPAYAAHARERNGRSRCVSELTELVAAAPAGALRRSFPLGWNTFQPHCRISTMKHTPNSPNDELYAREPMRVVFALSALLLGLLAALH